MSKNPSYEVRAAASARADISDIWEWTVQHFGNAAALRYESLIDQALADLAEDPQRLGAKPRSDLLPGLWLYHLVFSRLHVADEQIVKAPRHFVLFRHLQPGIIEVVRILHDSRDLAQHLLRNPVSTSLPPLPPNSFRFRSQPFR